MVVPPRSGRLYSCDTWRTSSVTGPLEGALLPLALTGVTSTERLQVLIVDEQFLAWGPDSV